MWDLLCEWSKMRYECMIRLHYNRFLLGRLNPNTSEDKRICPRGLFLSVRTMSTKLVLKTTVLPM